MPINVLINGAFGRMGQTTVKAIGEDENFALVGQIGREYDLKKAIQDSQAQVVIDFTEPNVVYQNTLAIIECGARPVIGTSGLTIEQIEDLKARCEKLNLGGIIAPNFSLGAVLMIKYAREIARYMPNVEIIEMHHEQKVDSPSGTAVRTAEALANVIKHPRESLKSAHESVPGARGANYRGIPIHSIRLPGFLAHQEIIFGESGETLTLRHDAIDRQSFMPGVRLACRKVVDMNRMVYGLEEIL